MSAPELRELWSRGGTAYGVAVRLGVPWVVEVLAVHGLDFIWIDLQHGLNNESGLMSMLQAMNGSRATSLVRVESLDPTRIARALEAGADGVIIPSVETADEARRAVHASRFPPAGTRSFSSTRIRFLPGGVEREVLCVAMIESARGVDNAEEISSVPGIDALFVGPNDLAYSLGTTIDKGRVLQPGAHADAVARIVRAATNQGSVAMISGDPVEMGPLGFRCISVGADDQCFVAGLTAALATRPPA